MSKWEPIGSLGMLFNPDDGGEPNVELCANPDERSARFNIERGEQSVSMTRAELRELLPILAAFADGEP